MMAGLKDRAKRLLRSAAVRHLLCWLIQAYVRLVYASGRWTVEGGEIPRRLRAEGRPFILAFWHGRLLMIPMAWQRLAPIHMLMSGHRDGRIIADSVAYFGVRSVAGSTTAGGSGALRQMLRHLKAGDCVGITPDGPRGPAMRASPGIATVARLAGVPVVPVTYATRRRRILASWDRFHVALPLSRGIFLWGEPIAVPEDADGEALEQWRGVIEERLNALTAAADRRMGHAGPAPAAPEMAVKAKPQPASAGTAPGRNGQALQHPARDSHGGSHGARGMAGGARG